MVVVHQRLAAESLPPEMFSALALLDLAKAYELVPHHRILDGARRFNFPLVVLRVVLAVFGLERRICISGCFSSSAVSLMFVLDRWHATWPMLALYLYIDDMGVLLQGTAHVILKYFSRPF